MDKKILYDLNFQAALVKAAKEGNIKARNLLLESISGYVVELSKQKSPSPSVTKDLIQESYIVLITDAIPKYNEKEGIPFRSYAVFWIVAAIEHFLNQNLIGFPFHIPNNRGFAYRRGKRKESGLENYSFVSAVTSNDGDVRDVFDLIPSDSNFQNTSHDYAYNEVEKSLNKLKRPKIRDIVERHLCVGKYRYENPLNISELAELYGVSNQRMSKITRYYGHQLADKRLKEVLVENSST